MTADLKQKHAKCRLSNHRVPWHPWSTIIFWYAKKHMCGPLTPSRWTLHQSKFLSHTRKKITLGPADPAGVPEEKIRELKKMQICMECDRMWNLQGFRQELHLPGHFSWKRKKRNNNNKKKQSRRKKVKSLSPPEYEDFMVCDTHSGVRWFLRMCGECDDTCGVRWRLWSAQVLLKCVIFWVCVPRKANRVGRPKFNS